MFQVLKNNSGVYNNKPLVYGFFEEQSSILINDKINEEIVELFNQNLVEKKLGSVNKIYTLKRLENSVLYLVSLGKLATYNVNQLEKALVKVNYKLGNELNVNLASFLGNLDPKNIVKTLVNSIGNYNYVYDELLTKKLNNDLTLNLLVEEGIDLDEAIQEGFNLTTAMSNVRDLVNKPYNYLSASDLASYAEDLVDSLENNKVSIRVYSKKEVENLGMNSFLGVNKGSTAEPKLIHITYNGGEGDYIGLVGKGVMFDTGGYSLKQNMINMKDDMAGSATVLGVLEAVVKNNIPVNLQVIICATDNRINGEALLPDDVITAMNKMTIEIKSTDAEGRLTLADGVCFAQKEGCKEVIDIATLTGAVVVALGEDITGLFGNDEVNVKKLLESSKEANEEFWQLPINDAIREQVRDSKVADLTNSTGRNMGSSSGAAFIEAFIEEGTKWMHLDIAGTAFTTSPRVGQFYGATGASMKTLYTYLKNKNAL